MGRNARYLIIIPAVLFALFAKPAKADTLGEWLASQSCATASIEVIDDSIVLHGPDGGCPGANWIKIETTIPADVDTIDFTWAYQTNDGWVYDPPQYGINGVYTLLTQQNNATGSLSIPVNEGDVFTFRQYSIDTCCQPGHLTISNLSLWESITSSTTTTTTSTTTVPSTTVPVTNPTTTTVQETTTTSSTTVPATTTSVENSTSTTSTTTTTSSVPQTTSTESTTTTTQPPETSTSTQPQISEPTPVEPYVPEEPEITETGTTSTTVEEATPEEMLPEETTTTDEPSPEPSPDTTEEPVVDTTLPEATDTPLEAPLSDEEVGSLIAEAETTEALVEALAELSPDQVKQVVEALLAEEPTQEQATAIASSPAALAVLTSDQATQVFEALDVTELDNTQLEALAEAVTNAPTEVKEAFEDSVDIFSDGLGTYVPVDSKIPVSERRTLIAIAAGATLTAASTRMKR